MAWVVKEIGSGVNDTRPKLLKLLTDLSVSVIVVEHKDRLTRFGYNYLEHLLKMQDRRIEVNDLAENGIEDLTRMRSILPFHPERYSVFRDVVISHSDRDAMFPANNSC
jgi:predicted site-specific integrase-resolvase